MDAKHIAAAFGVKPQTVKIWANVGKIPELSTITQDNLDEMVEEFRVLDLWDSGLPGLRWNHETKRFIGVKKR